MRNFNQGKQTNNRYIYVSRVLLNEETFDCLKFFWSKEKLCFCVELWMHGELILFNWLGKDDSDETIKKFKLKFSKIYAEYNHTVDYSNIKEFDNYQYHDETTVPKSEELTKEELQEIESNLLDVNNDNIEEDF